MTTPVETPIPDGGWAERLDDFVRYAEVKRLAGTIAWHQKKKRFRALAVLSLLAGEGKTLLCAALARAYAQSCRSRILVIDASGPRSRDALALPECLARSPSIDCIRINDYRDGACRLPEAGSDGRVEDLSEGPSPEAAVDGGPTRTLTLHDGDSFLIERAIGGFPGPYGLILIDTAPLNARNKQNVDPVLAARKADAAVLVVSRRSLGAEELDESMKALRDPAIRLLGLVANEGFAR